MTQYFIPTGTADPAPVVYIMPITDTYQLRVDRSEVVSGTGSILYAGQGYVANIDGLNVSEKVDLLTVNNSTAKVGYLSRSPSSLMFTLSATESEVDALVTLKNVEISPNSAMTITADNDNVSVMLNSTSATTYDLDMVINSAVITSQRFINSDIHITGGDRQIINIPAQSNASVILNTDVGNTGAQITSTILPNEAVQTDKLYLPLINR